MSGDIASSNLAQDKVKERNIKLTNYEKEIGLPQLKNSECGYLDLEPSNIHKMTPEECDEAAISLANYGFYIQRTLSRQKSIAKWLESKIMLAVANELNDYAGYYSHAQRQAVAITNNQYAKELEEFRLNTQMKIDLLDGLTFQINQLCRVLLEAKTTKRQTRSI